MSDKIFKQATKGKLRLVSTRGIVAVEDLWDLPLTELDNMAKKLRSHLKESEEGSFIHKAATTDAVATLEFEVVKAVIEERLLELELRDKKNKARATKARILELIAKKDEEDLEGKSKEELLKMVEDM